MVERQTTYTLATHTLAQARTRAVQGLQNAIHRSKKTTAFD
jgi:hypothetical protein